MAEVSRVVLVLAALAGGTVSNGVRVVSASHDVQKCNPIDEGRWDCFGETCFYYNGEWICV